MAEVPDNQEDITYMEGLGFREMRVKDLKVGDEVAYYQTFFEHSFGEVQTATVWKVERPYPGTYRELVKVYHDGGPTEAEELDPVWVRRSKKRG